MPQTNTVLTWCMQKAEKSEELWQALCLAAERHAVESVPLKLRSQRSMQPTQRWQRLLQILFFRQPI